MSPPAAVHPVVRPAPRVGYRLLALPLCFAAGCTPLLPDDQPPVDATADGSASDAAHENLLDGSREPSQSSGDPSESDQDPSGEAQSGDGEESNTADADTGTRPDAGSDGSANEDAGEATSNGPDASTDASNQNATTPVVLPALTGLSVDPGTLVPTFSPTRYQYRVTLGYLEGNFSVTAYSEADDVLTVNGTSLASGQANPFELPSLGTLGIDAHVSNDDGGQTYSLDVTRGRTTSLESELNLEGARFGYTVAMSDDGGTLAVGAPLEDGSTGSVSVFSRTGDTWSLLTYLIAQNPAMDEAFGSGLAISGDGSTLAVGSDQEVDGSVYIFLRSGSGFVQQAYLTHPHPGTAGDTFGAALSLSGSGDVLAVGVPNEDGCDQGSGADNTWDGCENSGAVYAYRRVGGSWGSPSYLKASDSTAAWRFGRSVSLSDDGKYLAVGAPGYSANTGAVYMMASSGSAWSQQTRIDHPTNLAVAAFGDDVVLDDAGAMLLTSAPYQGVGAVYVHTRSGSTWTMRSTLPSCGGSSVAYFGSFLGLSGDGKVAAAGPAAGATCVYKGSGADWTRSLWLSNTEGGLAFSSDGEHFAAGYFRNANNAGMVRIYQ